MKYLDFIFAARPLLIMPVWSVFLVSWHYHQQLAEIDFLPVDFLNLTGLTLLFAGALYLNQIFDYESDLINGKVGFLQKNIISHKAMMIAFLTVTLVSLAGSIIISWVTFFIYLQIFILGYFYSASPLRLKDRMAGGLLVNGYTYGFLVSVVVMPHLNFHNAGLLGWDNPFYFFCTIISITCVTTIPDIEGDRVTGKKTVAVVLGCTATLILSLGFMLGSVYFAWHSRFLELTCLSLFGSLLLLISIFVNSTKMTLLTAKLPLLLLTLLAGYYYPVYFLFIVALLVLTRIYYKKRFNLIYPELA